MTHSRRYKALRWLVILVVVLTIATVTGTYQVLPSMAVADGVTSRGLSPTETVGRLYNPARWKTLLFYLEENDDVFLLSTVQCKPFSGGWTHKQAAILERDDTAPIQAMTSTVLEWENPCDYVFGQVRQAGQVWLYVHDKANGSLIASYCVPEEDYLTHKGNTYFITDATDFYAVGQYGVDEVFTYALQTPEGEELGGGTLEQVSVNIYHDMD